MILRTMPIVIGLLNVMLPASATDDPRYTITTPSGSADVPLVADKRPTLREAMVAAKVGDREREQWVQLIRANPRTHKPAPTFLRIADLLDGRVRDDVMPGDVLNVGAMPQFKEPKKIGEYYVGGHVRRVGVYGHSGRQVMLSGTIR
jgi:hypothetical protein